MEVAAPSSFGRHVDSELSRFKPVTIEDDSYIVLTVANDREQYHVDEVLELALQERSPMID